MISASPCTVTSQPKFYIEAGETLAEHFLLDVFADPEEFIGFTVAGMHELFAASPPLPAPILLSSMLFTSSF